MCIKDDHNGSNMKCLRSRGGAGEHFVPKNGKPLSGDPLVYSNWISKLSVIDSTSTHIAGFSISALLPVLDENAISGFSSLW